MPLERVPSQAGSSGLVDRFLSLTVIPPPDYPVAAPTLRFNSKVNIPGVVDASGAVSPDASHDFVRGIDELAMGLLLKLLAHGLQFPSSFPPPKLPLPRPSPFVVQVDPRRVPKLAAWTPTSNIVEALAELQQIARNAPSAQPRDGETY